MDTTPATSTPTAGPVAGQPLPRRRGAATEPGALHLTPAKKVGAQARREGGQGGFVLVSVYLLGVLAVAGSAALMTRSLWEGRAGERAQMSEEAFYLAEAGVDSGLAWLRAQPFPPGGTQPLVIQGGWQALGNGRFMAVVEPDPGNPGSAVKRYVVRGLGSAGPEAAPLAAREANLTVQSEAFSRFVYFSTAEATAWGARVWFVTGDRLDGPVHSNGQFNMYGRPEFYGPVSSARDSLNLWGGGPPTTDPQFHDGLTLGTDPLPLPGYLPGEIANAAEGDGTLYRGITAVYLEGGSLLVWNPSSGGWRRRPIPPKGVLHVRGGDLWLLGGTLDGQLTVSTERNVRVFGSVRYADNPDEDPESDDLLGILAGRNVQISPSAPYNVHLDASILALNSSFGVEAWYRGLPRGTLSVRGGIIQRNRGPVGTFNSVTGRQMSGYRKAYRYDERLRTMVPPYFLLTGDMVPLVWEEPER